MNLRIRILTPADNESERAYRLFMHKKGAHFALNTIHPAVLEMRPPGSGVWIEIPIVEEDPAPR